MDSHLEEDEAPEGAVAVRVRRCGRLSKECMRVLSFKDRVALGCLFSTEVRS